MTPYEQGFMSKCAELGVDPNRLLKRAGLLRILSADVRPVGAAVSKGGKRFLELLLGGSKDLRTAHAGARSVISKALADVEKTHPEALFAQRGIAEDTLAMLKRINLGGKHSNVTAPLATLLVHPAYRHDGIPQWAVRNALRATRGHADDVLDTERVKVLASRLGAAAGVGGAAYGVGKAVSGGKD